MPIHKRAPVSTQFASTEDYEGFTVEIQPDDMVAGFAENLPIQGEIIESFDIADSPGGWHLVWLDQAFEFDGATHAHLMISPRWVAKPLDAGGQIPVQVRLVPDVARVERGAPDIDELPLVGKGFVLLIEEEESEPA